jgi:adenosine kinase
LNLSAPFIPLFFGVQLSEVVPYCDYIIGNESEAEAWATATGHPNPKDVTAVARTLAALPKSNASRPRIVVITQGALETVLVSSANPENAKAFPVHRLKDDQIVDTNGAGDAFAGGFLGAIVAGKTVEEAVEVGHKMGTMCVQEASWLPLSDLVIHVINPLSIGRTAIQVAEGPNPLGLPCMSSPSGRSQQ